MKQFINQSEIGESNIDSKYDKIIEVRTINLGYSIAIVVRLA